MWAKRGRIDPIAEIYFSESFDPRLQFLDALQCIAFETSGGDIQQIGVSRRSIIAHGAFDGGSRVKV